MEYAGSWTKSSWANGSGYTFEAKVISKRRHTIKTGNDADLPTRLVAIQVEVVGDIMRREWDAKTGEELIPQITQNEKSFKGYLHNFNSTAAHAVNTSTVEILVGYLKKMQGVGLVSSEVVSKLHPKNRHNLELWGDQSNFLDLEFEEGDIIRVKTIGDSIVLETMTVVDQGSAKKFGAGGSALKDNLTSKIASAQVQDQPAEPPRSAEEDAEWA